MGYTEGVTAVSSFLTIKQLDVNGTTTAHEYRLQLDNSESTKLFNIDTVNTARVESKSLWIPYSGAIFTHEILVFFFFRF